MKIPALLYRRGRLFLQTASSKLVFEELVDLMDKEALRNGILLKHTEVEELCRELWADKDRNLKASLTEREFLASPWWKNPHQIELPEDPTPIPQWFEDEYRNLTNDRF